MNSEQLDSTGKNTNFRVKSGKQRRSYLSSQRCSSGNITQKSKIQVLAKENTFLKSQFSNGNGIVGQQVKNSFNLRQTTTQ